MFTTINISFIAILIIIFLIFWIERGRLKLWIGKRLKFIDSRFVDRWTVKIIYSSLSAIVTMGFIKNDASLYCALFGACMVGFFLGKDIYPEELDKPLSGGIWDKDIREDVHLHNNDKNTPPQKSDSITPR
jgi:hypothetical protein